MKKFKYIIVLFVMGLISFSCTDLDEEIFSEITTDNYYQNSNNIYAALVNNYAKAFSTGWSDARYFLQEVTADQLMIPTRGKHGYNGGEYVRLHEHKWTVEENFVYNGWAAPFQGIALCNNTLSDFENLDFSTFKLTEETKNEYIAELRALRVWNYMFLIDFFRHVPIVTDIEEVKAQSTPLEVFNFMESELLAILPDLPKNRGVSRFDQAGVASILVRLYLNAEKWIGISKYDECEQMAQAILDGKYGEYSIDPDYRGPFRSGINGYRSKENIMEFAIKKNYFEASWLYNMWMHYQDRYSLDNDWQGWNGGNLAPSRDLYGNLYQDKLGMPFEKFPWLPQSKDLFQMNSIPEIRLAEIYYSLAECKYRSGDKIGAARLLDAVRKRYYKAEDWSKFSYESNISKLTDDEFVDELGREFIGERHRRIDLIRWNRFSEGAWWDKTPDATNQDVFPIPYRALNANPLLKQTTAGF